MNDQTATAEERLAQRIDSNVTNALAVSDQAGGLSFANAGQVMEFAKMMAVAGIAIPKHLRTNPGACLAIVIQALEWRLSPYAVANKSYSVNDRLAYESQLVQAVILQRAPIKGRFTVAYEGEGGKRVCRVSAVLSDGTGTVEYESPPFDKITPKNSPLWKSDPDQQQFYYSGRALCRRHFPDVLLGIYAKDELEDRPIDDKLTDYNPLKGKIIEHDASPREDAALSDASPDAPEGDHDAPAATTAPVSGGGASSVQTEPVAATTELPLKPQTEKGGEPDTRKATPVEAPKGGDTKKPSPAKKPQLTRERAITLLTGYSRHLDSALYTKDISTRSDDFWGTLGGFPDEGTKLGNYATELYNGHLSRTKGSGAPGDIDAIIQKVNAEAW